MRRSRRRPVRLGIAIAILAGLSIALHLRATWETHTTILTETEHCTGELTGELRVTQLSDFHSITRFEQIDHIVGLAKQSRPHLIALTGDLINNTHNPTLEPVERLYQAGGQILPRISKGQYHDGGATLFIDSGIGVSGPPYRLFNQSQITLHRIRP